MKTQSVPERSAIPTRHTWNAESVFPSLVAWETELKAIEAALQDFSNRQGSLKESPTALAAILKTRDELLQRASKIQVYADFSHAVDKTDPAASALPGRAQTLIGATLAAIAFVEPEILEIGQVTIQNWQQSEDALDIYQHFFDNLFRKQAHVRSSEVEALLGMLADPFAGAAEAAGLLTDADLNFRPARDSAGATIEVAQGSIDLLMVSPDRLARQSAWESYADGYLSVQNTLAANLSTAVKQNVLLARARRHTSALEASLFEENLPRQVFDNLIQTFIRHLPVWQRYCRLRARALKVETLEPFDIWAPLTRRPAQVTYPQAVEWVCQALASLGSEYVETIRRGCLDERWVDVYPNRGKSSGAFSGGSPGTHPFILMSYTDDVISLGTLAHELGHSMHSYLTWQTQPVVYTFYSNFVAEVASNFHQAMLRAYLLEHETDRDLQIGVIEEAMANFHRYFLIMPTLARFEAEIYRRIEAGEGLEATGMNALTANLFEEAYNGTLHIDQQRMGITWATFQHLYMNFYVFQYATGISGANALAARILRGEPGAATAYLGFLKAGASQYPLDALRQAGVDLATPAPVEETFGVLSGLLDRLEKLLF